MTAQSEKSIQELREEIKRLEDTVAQQKEIIKFRGDELNRLNPREIDKLTGELNVVRDERDSYYRSHRVLQQKVGTCVQLVLGFGPNLGNPEDLLPQVTERVSSLEKQLRIFKRAPMAEEELKKVREEVEVLKKERDANMMLALDAQRDVRRSQEQLKALQVSLGDSAQQQEIKRLRQEIMATRGINEGQRKEIESLRQKQVDFDYRMGEVLKEHAEAKNRYFELKEAEENRIWASTDRNAYDALLAIRDMVVPEVPLGECSAAVIKKVQELQQGYDMQVKATNSMVERLNGLDASLRNERFLKEEIYRVYAELRKLFDLEHVPSIDPKKVHACIVHMLKVKDNEIADVSATLLKERTLACEEIRRLTELIKAEGDK